MSDEKLITVITSVYNKAPYLETWAISVASQTYLDRARIIVIDDKSTDGSLDLLEEYATKYNIPVEIFVHEKNLGLLHTILQAYRLTDTKYFTVLDADDYWLSELKLEKAVTFLEAHEDYSAYCTNYVRMSDEKSSIEFSADVPSQTLSTADEVFGHIHTASIVFRNFFTPELLDEMDMVSRGKRVHACETDSFMNYLTFHFGKVYFDSSVDSLWRADVGIFGALTEFEQCLNIMNEHRQIFEFYKRLFGMDRNSFRALAVSMDYYQRAVDIFARVLKNCTLSDFRGRAHFNQRFSDYGETDIEKVVNAILEQENFLKKLGFKIDGNDFSFRIKLNDD